MASRFVAKSASLKATEIRHVTSISSKSVGRHHQDERLGDDHRDVAGLCRFSLVALVVFCFLFIDLLVAFRCLSCFDVLFHLVLLMCLHTFTYVWYMSDIVSTYFQSCLTSF